MDTDINNYSREDLLKVLELDNFTDNDTILSTINKILKSYKSRNNDILVQFFEEAKDKLLNEKNWNFALQMRNPLTLIEGFNGEGSERDENESDDFGEKSPGEKTDDEDLSDNNQVNNWIENQYASQPNPSQDKKITSRKQQVQILDDETHPIMNRNRLGVGNSYSSKIGQGSINPNLKQITSKSITMDSQYRDNIIPYSSDVNSITCSTNYTCSLSENLKNVIQLQLKSILIPKTWYMFDTNLCNSSFWIEDLSTSLMQQIVITPGNYTIPGLITEINEDLLECDLSFITLEISNKNVSNPIVQFKNTSDTSYNILFIDNSCNETATPMYQQTLGYMLGYRITTNGITNFSVLLDNSSTVIAQTTSSLVGTQYFRLVIDDFNNNYVTNAGVGIEKTQSKLSMPSYAGKVINDTSNCSFTNCIDNVAFVPTVPPQLTQAQMYSLNQIYCNRKAISNRPMNPTVPNTLAIIQLPNNMDEHDNYFSITGFSSWDRRVYFGPVSIERLKVTLLDDKGNILNLHGHDWSFTLIADQLYQY